MQIRHESPPPLDTTTLEPDTDFCKFFYVVFWPFGPWLGRYRQPLTRNTEISGQLFYEFGRSTAIIKLELTSVDCGSTSGPPKISPLFYKYHIVCRCIIDGQPSSSVLPDYLVSPPPYNCATWQQCVVFSTHQTALICSK